MSSSGIMGRDETRVELSGNALQHRFVHGKQNEVHMEKSSDPTLRHGGGCVCCLPLYNNYRSLVIQ